MRSRTFHNTICCRDGALDPHRTAGMKSREDKEVQYLQKRKVALSDEYAYRSDPNAWLPKYTRELSSRIASELQDIRLYFNEAPDARNSAYWMEAVHGSRRMIALYHQEKELTEQGPDIPLLAFQSRMSIPYGNR